MCDRAFWVNHVKIPYHTATVESLFTLSSRVAANYIACNVPLIRGLSSSAKSALANLLGKRNGLTLPVLLILAHRDLTSVTMQGCHTRDSAVNVLSAISMLRTLKIPENQISTSGLMRLFPHLPHLQELDISSCPSVTNEVLTVMADSCPKLHLINLGKCSGFGDRGLQYVLSNLHTLVVLDISYTQVTDASLKALAEGPSRQMIKELHIDGCKSLTSACGQSLVEMKHLTVLSFYECPNLLESDWFTNTGQTRQMKNISFTIE